MTRSRGRRSPLAWARTNLFATPLDAAVTLAVLLFLLWVVPPIARWAVIDATWTGETRAACDRGGACWAVVTARWRQMLAGFYPPEELWRVGLAMLLLAGAVLPLAVSRWTRFILIAGPLGVAAAFAVLWGAGPLSNVGTEYWGGFFLNVLIGVAGMMFSLPIGVLLALGRRSRLPAIKGLCVVFIEFVRGVPLITLLFMASVMLPLFAPAGASFDLLARALVVVTLFSSAYLAEAVRGGLQAVPESQRDAARALGIGPLRTTVLIVLPQALRISIPAIVNSFIGLFKDTTLLFVIALLDVMGVMRQALADYAWQGVDAEGYAFVGLVFFLACFGLSRWSAALERRRDRRPELERPLMEPA